MRFKSVTFDKLPPYLNPRPSELLHAY